ncbi:MAG: hypothetical protein JSW58_05310 [Candidatus Latescibacterota bacterium]|nr:MAG: hypothetical protein JSW58_05310 [Candidatus Latescibacterota bacterium]
MFKRLVATGIVVVVIALSVVITNAQTPYVAVYFDRTFQTEAKPPYPPPQPCPGVGVFDTLYVAASNFNILVTGAEFQIDYPALYMTWVGEWSPTFTHPQFGELAYWPVKLGTSPTGVSLGAGDITFQNGFAGAVRLLEVLIMWTCDVCTVEQGLIVNGNPLGFGTFPALIERETYIPYFGIGMTALVCATLPTEETTWSRVKALYTD